MLKALSDRPNVEALERVLTRLLNQRGETLEFIVLFGSMARGDWSRGSDYDLLVGLRGEDGQRLIDRMGEFATLVDGNVEMFPYSRAEWQRMFKHDHLLMLEALEHGIVLWDRGGFARMREQFGRWRASGRVRPWRAGWKIRESAGADAGAARDPI